MNDTTGATVRIPIWILAGVALIAIWWPIAWFQVRPVSDYYFFPLWLGFILTVDGLVAVRTGTSLISRHRWRVGILFLLSVPLWWLFEAFNQILQNWHYHLPEPYSWIGYRLRASLAFSTVIPAVFVASELVASLKLDPLRFFGRRILSQRTLLILHVGGWVMLALVLIWPKYAFPLVWVSVFFIVDPLATLKGGRSVGFHLRLGDWKPVFNVAAGTLLCGFFWEMWNILAMPKWTYSVPYVDFLRLFEMPALGYGGYISFGWEIFSLVALAGALAPGLRIPMPRVAAEGNVARHFDRNL